MQEIWEVIKGELRELISPSGFSLWIAPLEVGHGAADELQLICPNVFALRWVKANYLPLIQQALGRLGSQAQVKLVAGRAERRPPAAVSPGQLCLPVSPRHSRHGRPLHRDFTFDKFVVGGGNRLAYRAAEALAHDDTFYNGILFLTSGPGLGKSHLSQAVGNHFLTSRPSAPILYVTAEDFTNDMVRALKGGQMARFKERYRGECEVLLLEEVQFLSGKEKIQAELCFTLDTLLERGKKLVFTSCYHPGEISQISKELRSRLTGGLITPIGPPDFPTRVNILARKAEHRGMSASAEVLEYLAEHLTGDVRRLESALDCLAARSTLLQEPLSLRLAQEVLASGEAYGLLERYVAFLRG
uniref:Chromosomal replication initiator protein DnaA n=1 Tax=Desulfobacca acetoxidans TaxID=60893 RepID=A0A7V4G9P8_9BACT